ncbi:IS3-like element IS51 family transposase [Pseudomonas amygdali]|uniref:IS3-like element IS51 family transposase n=1 Tax=Pseudomonas amygdali TaxID=47877 RepID=UPI001FB36716|nr:IS3-like element IS51 family transposase [Pseudomonas amygdali]UNO24362.1 IS3 family transposase [Pseudomonas amygdali pv. aesculi]UNO25524.1 IS3 family transposase [Pseudomonas amygdali pv. aesculi]
MKKLPKYSPEVRERAIRMVFEHLPEYESQWATISAIAPKIGCTPETLRLWVRQSERNSGQRDGLSTVERERVKLLERENRQLRQANEILRKASAYFCPGGARPPIQTMKTFIDENRQSYGVEPICKVLPIAPSTYYRYAAQQADPSQQSARAQRDQELGEHIQRVWDEHFHVYGVRKVWRQLLREGQQVARCTVQRLMGELVLQGVVRGKPVKTTVSDQARPCPQDHVNRQFVAECPNALWVSDFTYVSTWQGFVYVAFIVDVFARFIVGWKVSSSARTDFVLDALEQALYARRPVKQGGLIHHSDRGVQYVSIRYTERLVEAGIEPSVGSVGDSYDNALAETINGLYKAEVIHRRSWPTRGAVELETLKWVDWFNHRRLLEPIGHIPPVEAEAIYYQQLTESAQVA